MTISREEIPVGVEVSTEPDDGDGSSTYVHAGVCTSGQNHTASSFLDDESPSDEQVAEQLIKVVSAAAQMHSSGAWMALQRRLVQGGSS